MNNTKNYICCNFAFICISGLSFCKRNDYCYVQQFFFYSSQFPLHVIIINIIITKNQDKKLSHSFLANDGIAGILPVFVFIQDLEMSLFLSQMQ